VAACFSVVLCNFDLVKKYKIVRISKTSKIREIISTDLESLELSKKFIYV